MPTPGGKRGENRIKVLNDVFLTPHHQAIATREARDAAAGANIHIMHPVLLQFSGTPHIVTVIGVAAINDDIARFE